MLLTSLSDGNDGKKGKRKMKKKNKKKKKERKQGGNLQRTITVDAEAGVLKVT